MKTARHQLEGLLSESLASARARQQSAFDERSGRRRQVVIFGSGRLGRSVVRGLSGTDLEPVAFADNNPSSWGAVVDGLRVLRPQEAAIQYSREAVFVIAIWHPSNSPLMSALLKQLQLLDCTAVPFPLLFWRHANKFLPYFFWDLPEHLLQNKQDIAAAFSLLHDEASRQVYASQLQLRLRADFECIGVPFPGEQYFPGLFSMTTGECFVDCGAYNGDTLEAFIAQTDNRFRMVIAFEADPAVLPDLERVTKSVGSRAVLQKVAVGAENGTVHFAGDGIGGGCISASEGQEVPCVRLDDALAQEQVSFIKMDIEGAELEALEGGRSVIRRDRPILAVCAYHKPDHLWRVVSALHRQMPNSALYLRSHCADGLDTVCYAVPPERKMQGEIASPGKSQAQAQGSRS